MKNTMTPMVKTRAGPEGKPLGPHHLITSVVESTTGDDFHTNVPRVGALRMMGATPANCTRSRAPVTNLIVVSFAASQHR